MSTVQTAPPPGLNIPPANMQPGFVAPAPAATVQAEPAPPAQAAAPAGLDAAIAALTAALSGQAASTPVTPAAPAGPQVNATPAAPGNLNEFDVAGIDDPIIRSMATVMQTVGKGVDLDRAIGKAISDGRVDLIDVAYLREVGGENAQSLITIAQNLVQAVEAKGNAVNAKIHGLAGGEQHWNNGVAAFNTAAPVELRTVVAQMLDSGKENLIEAAAKIVVQFSKGAGVLPQVNPTVQAGASGVPAAQALSKDAFQAELRKLDPNSRSFQNDRGALFTRRQLGRQLGM